MIADAVAARELEGPPRAALSEHGEGFTISTAFGSVVIPQRDRRRRPRRCAGPTRHVRAEALGRATAGRQSSDVLLRALAERHPDLGDHLDGVAELAAEVGDAWASRARSSSHLRHAAALHDIGKVAIPDAIIAKPGPLTDEEWAFMRRHTLIGERIIAAAPRSAPPRGWSAPRTRRGTAAATRTARRDRHRARRAGLPSATRSTR